MHAVSHAARLDMREGGEWSLVQRLKNDAIYALVSLALLAVRHVPPAHLRRVGRWLGRVVHALAWGPRALARRNIGLAFPETTRRERAAIARASFVNLGGHLGDVVGSLHTPAALLPFDDASRELLRDALLEGRGVVLPSAHLGPWERVAATLAASFPFAAVVRESYDPRLDDVVGSARKGAGVDAIPRGAPGAPTRIVRALRSGVVLGIPMDLRTRAASVTVPFLGADSPTAVGPARVALRIGAPVIVSTVEPREGRALVVTCTRIDTRGIGEVELTRRVNAELDRRIRMARDHWPWMHARR
jgi:KDO2-lipid IV(A) lauroyltransferase